MVDQEYTIDTHEHMHRAGCENHTAWAVQEIWTFATQDRRVPDVYADTRLNKAL
ncbi:60S ribosomal protein L31 [Heterocephalus glaber]|uniref:60S ribosomal protein L31 n=1 Tax=Heterocephalus glaber TaxID=10181 RepID=G5BI18_HETGA|nr:60S ribosomal protein L31 [Heterocephalus glaber]